MEWVKPGGLVGLNCVRDGRGAVFLGQFCEHGQDHTLQSAGRNCGMAEPNAVLGGGCHVVAELAATVPAVEAVLAESRQVENAAHQLYGASS